MKTFAKKVMGLCMSRKIKSGYDLYTPFYLQPSNVLVATNGYILFMTKTFSLVQVNEMFTDMNNDECRPVPNMGNLLRRMLCDVKTQTYKWSDLPELVDDKMAGGSRIFFGDYQYNVKQMKLISRFLGVKGRTKCVISFTEDGMLRFDHDGHVLMLNRLGYVPGVGEIKRP